MTDAEIREALKTFSGSPSEFVQKLDAAAEGDRNVVVREAWRNAVEVAFLPGKSASNAALLAALDASEFHAKFWNAVHRNGSRVYHVPMDLWWEKGALNA